MKNLLFCLMTAQIDCKETRHAQVVMKELGITYQHAVPQSIADCWNFFNCEGNIENLPEFLTEMKKGPQDYVGHGLSQEMADKLTQSSKI